MKIQTTTGTEGKWSESKQLISLFRKIGQTSLIADLQDSHSGNMSMLWTDQNGKEKIVITSTGSQKGDLEPEHICFISRDDTDFGYYKASSESDIHSGILAIDRFNASFHCHTKYLNIMTLDDEDKPNKPKPFIPVDPLGFYHCGHEIPVDWVKIPSGGAEMTKIIPERLSKRPVTIIQTHGVFVGARTLSEAFFLAHAAENSAYTAYLMTKLNIDIETYCQKILTDSSKCFYYKPSGYTINDDDVCEFPDEKELIKEFYKTGARIFESNISSFHTGSFSVRGVNSILYAPKASMPRNIGGPLLKIGISESPADDQELKMHKNIYKKSDFQTIMHCYIPEAEAHAHFIYPGEKKSCDRITAIDAEGSFLYLVIPVVPPDIDIDELIKLLHEYKTVVVRGGGVWSVGHQSLSEVLHHPSSVREICKIRIGAFERGLEVRKLEPEKAKNW